MIHALAKIKMGARIASEPFIWLDNTANSDELVGHILSALRDEKKVSPNPANWSDHAKEYLRKIGLNKEKELYDGSKYVQIVKQGKIISFCPTINLPKGGFTNISPQKIAVAEDDDVIKIKLALEDAFNLCE
ncbi:hypothetical protein Q4E93_06455 [Flavitalea sp. BT771]|uniref:hypothetical protein n=1 Tax=Flavitalea sp. BT771 TaxID=3063329 RepID=UPI0026E3BCAC|nr:hypothetical protein [Flavitalea sp. BT771]MDO6430216.1 hypothetical protein [Flavitalea sp. BT771]MDV6219644.1 hypothetical protein [Flavitalea sp. BT771]